MGAIKNWLTSELVFRFFKIGFVLLRLFKFELLEVFLLGGSIFFMMFSSFISLSFCISISELIFCSYSINI